MKKKFSLIIAEILLEVCLLVFSPIVLILAIALVVQIMSPDNGGIIPSSNKDTSWKDILIYPVLFALGSLTARLVMLEIPLKFAIRRARTKEEKFSIFRMFKVIIAIHTPLFVFGAYLLFGLQGKLDNEGILIFSLVVYCVSIFCALFAPYLLYKIWGEIFDTCFDKNFQRKHGLSHFFERKGWMSKIEYNDTTANQQNGPAK